jgi:choline-sulfatase
MGSSSAIPPLPVSRGLRFIRPIRALAVAAAISAALAACSPRSSDPGAESSPAAGSTGERPAILLVTLDTTRADALQPESTAVETPALAALAARGLRFSQAYSTAPMTLPAHASMLTGLYPAAHGIHENDRRLAAEHPVLAGRLQEAGYATAAFVSGFPLDRQFGLARGFDHYDDELDAAKNERRADATTDRALAHLATADAGRPLFLWVHYYDPHEPYAPPEPFRSRYADRPYLGEIAFMDRELGRLVQGFEARFRDRGFKILVAGDHGEGLGEHGEALHGNLLYQGVMRVPLIVAGTGISPGVREEPVSTRRVFDTVLGWAGGEANAGLLGEARETVLGEAMRPHLQYGWQPQVMAIGSKDLGKKTGDGDATTSGGAASSGGPLKVIRSGQTEVYDVRADPGEAQNLAGRLPPGLGDLERELARAVRDYPLPAPASAAPASEQLTGEERKRLASLGYASWDGTPQNRLDAPSPRDMSHLFGDLDRGSGLFLRGEYAQAIPVFERVLAADPGNLVVALRLAVAHSVLGRDARALEYFERARKIDPASPDLQHYLGMHHLSRGRWEDAGALFSAVLASNPERLPALEALARVREEQGQIAEAAALLERAANLQREPAPTLLKAGELRMAQGDTPAALAAFEQARALQGQAFSHHLELGVLYLAVRRLPEARDSLDQVPPSHPDSSLALFKRAQVSVLLGEPDRVERIRAATAHADATTRGLIENEPLFRDAAAPKR